LDQSRTIVNHEWNLLLASDKVVFELGSMGEGNRSGNDTLTLEVSQVLDVSHWTPVVISGVQKSHGDVVAFRNESQSTCLEQNSQYE
jgi:hypothetical protein